MTGNEPASSPATPPRLARSISAWASNPDDGKLCRLTISEFMSAVLKGQVPNKVQALSVSSPFMKDLLCALDLLGVLEPMEGHRPGVGRPRVRTRRLVRVGRATARTGADATPASVKVWSACGTLQDGLVLGVINIEPVNLTAMEAGEIEYNAPLKAWKRLCPEFQGSDSCVGIIHSMDNIVLPPGASVEIHLLNHSTCSTGLWFVETETWLAR